MAVIDGITIGREERSQVLVEFPRDHELVQFLPHREGIQLVGLHDPVDRTKDVFLEQVLDPHGSNLTAPV